MELGPMTRAMKAETKLNQVSDGANLLYRQLHDAELEIKKLEKAIQEQKVQIAQLKADRELREAA